MKNFTKGIALFILFSLSLTFTSCSTSKKGLSRNDLIYFIMTDRFYDGNKNNNDDVNVKDSLSFHGGDLRGIIEKLDYIKDTGATAIWITPILKNGPNGYHGYWTFDFNSLDPHFGTIDDMKELVKKAHNMGIKVILDYVVNHTGINSPIYKEHPNWFNPPSEITDYSNQKNVEEGWLAGLPDFNQYNNEAKEFLIESALNIIEETNIDGMRLDTVKHVPKEFWQEFSNRVKEKYPDFFFIGEVITGNTNYLDTYNKTGIDTFVDYPLYYGITNTFKKYGDPINLVNSVNSIKYLPYTNILGNFIDNHDTSRYISVNGEEYFKQALTFIMSYPGIPIIYYGTEIGQLGFDDPNNRKDMNFNQVLGNEIYEFYKKLVELRKDEIIKYGDFSFVDYNKNYLCYKLSYDNKDIYFIINLTENPYEVEINIDKDQSFKEYFTDKTFKTVDKKIFLNLTNKEIIILK